MSDDATAEFTAAVRAVGDITRTTLGPFGATKLVVGRDGTVTATASGSAVLDRLDVNDPAVAVLRTGAEDFRARHGDGTATLVALTGALLTEAASLVDEGLHPTTVATGYEEALAAATDELDRRARPLSAVSTATVARSALTGARDPATRRIVGERLERLAETLGGDGPFEGDQVKVVARLGARAETELVRGVVLEKGPVVDGMARRAEDAGIALLSSTVDVPRLGGADGQSAVKATLGTASFEDRAAFGDAEREGFERRLTAAVDAGCRFIATSRAVNERVERTLANHGVIALQRVDDADLARLARATGARVVPGLDQVTADTLGRADVAVRRKAGRDLTFVESERDVYTLFCRAPDPRSVGAFERSVEAALSAVEYAEREGTVVPGGGAIEVSMARAVRERARSVAGREQLAMNGFADALLTLPRAHAENAGFDGWTGLIRLLVAHDEGRDATGVDALAGEVMDVMVEDGVVDPTALKREVLASATEFARQLVRIDGRVLASDLGESATGPPEPE